ncbi:MAG: SsrA-binding protein SmpB [Bacteroidota bacterium]|nr:SsrA-binding protein SmpB [Bacteroidota bacterium]
MNKKINIKNKKAKFDYYIKSKFTAGIVLSGTEIKSIRDSKASISESYCEFSKNNELFIVNMNIELYEHGNNFNHRPKAKRKLLLNKKELSKLYKEVKKTSLTIIPLNVFINDKGIAKINIALAQGKKLYDKRQILKSKEIKRSLNKLKKS